jgi:hypothetical protein
MAVRPVEAAGAIVGAAAGPARRGPTPPFGAEQPDPAPKWETIRVSNMGTTVQIFAWGGGSVPVGTAAAQAQPHTER